uniref:LMBR1-like membrane protein n=2 Tax=Entomoneis paludosa TaxID=265537 RepID=A0A7S2YMM4_9STRA
MVDVFLVIAIVVAIAILLVAAVYLLVYYQHPDDHNDAYIPKFVVIIGFCLAGWTVLLFPLDVANNEGYAGCDGYDTKFCGGLNMEAMWTAIFWMIPIWIFVMIPFSTFYYEADDGTLMMGTAYGANHVRKSRVGQAVCYQLFVLIIVGLFFLVTYLTLSDTNIPIEDYTQNNVRVSSLLASNTIYSYPNLGVNATFDVNELADMNPNDQSYYTQVTDNGGQEITLQVSVATFYAGLMAWLGWWLFALFGGVGLAALPLDLILAFVNRPKHMDAVEFAEAQLSLRERVNELVDIGELIKIERDEKANAGIVTSGWSFDTDKRKAARDERQALLGFKQAVFLLEKDVEDFQAMSVNYENYNPLLPFISLICGICSAIMSLFWFIHICIFVYPDPPLAPFLNNYFEWFDNWFPLFGVLSVALFVVYLLFCAVKGCFKFGIRFMFFQIHPMKIGKTYMSSFMFNIALVLFCALPVVQFSQEAFSDYAAFSEIRQIFGVQIQYLDFFTWFWTKQVFIYVFFSISVLTSIYLACRPRDQSANAAALRDRLRAHKSHST